ncbi:hypothetical protein OsI_31581 [Oryza sativa Indica Group]|uniref:C2 domain-containing protein n=1 Tax=Oryza sativa subsp. indica TaxID=39946 RepID=B8BCL3_ORYSI|nr:hypothetical protein OsI_31581 [Oryza sativa Indica Group]
MPRLAPSRRQVKSSLLVKVCHVHHCFHSRLEIGSHAIEMVLVAEDVSFCPPPTGRRFRRPSSGTPRSFVPRIRRRQVVVPSRRDMTVSEPQQLGPDLVLALASPGHGCAGSPLHLLIQVACPGPGCAAAEGDLSRRRRRGGCGSAGVHGDWGGQVEGRFRRRESGRSAEGEEELSMTLLPDGLHAEEVETLSSVCVSEGKITYVAVSGHPGGLPSEGNVLVWILVDPKHSQWKLRTVTPMSVIWDTICHALGLQRGAPPVISVLDRQDASVLYFFIQQHLVGFHLTRRLVKHSCICGHQGGTSRMVLSMGTPPIAPTQGSWQCIKVRNPFHNIVSYDDRVVLAEKSRWMKLTWAILGGVQMPAFMGCESVEIEATSEAWNLRASVIEAHDLRVPAASPGLPFDVRVKIKIGFQSARTQRSVASTSSGSAFAWEWEEDLMFVVSEPLDESLIVLVKDRTMIKEPARRGARPTSALLPAKEAAHVCSEYRPTAKQHWKPPVGVLELGIIGACGLLSTKTKGGAKYSTDAYCVAKYGKKWVRKRTVTDSPTASTRGGTSSARGRCTTRARCSRWRVFADDGDERQDYRIRKVRVHVCRVTRRR